MLAPFSVLNFCFCIFERHSRPGKEVTSLRHAINTISDALTRPSETLTLSVNGLDATNPISDALARRLAPLSDFYLAQVYNLLNFIPEGYLRIARCFSIGNTTKERTQIPKGWPNLRVSTVRSGPFNCMHRASGGSNRKAAR